LQGYRALSQGFDHSLVEAVEPQESEQEKATKVEKFIGRVVTEIPKDHKWALNLNGRSLILIGIPD